MGFRKKKSKKSDKSLDSSLVQRREGGFATPLNLRLFQQPISQLSPVSGTPTDLNSHSNLAVQNNLSTQNSSHLINGTRLSNLNLHNEPTFVTNSNFMAIPCESNFTSSPSLNKTNVNLTNRIGFQQNKQNSEQNLQVLGNNNPIHVKHDARSRNPVVVPNKNLGNANFSSSTSLSSNNGSNNNFNFPSNNLTRSASTANFDNKMGGQSQFSNSMNVLNRLGQPVITSGFIPRKGPTLQRRLVPIPKQTAKSQNFTEQQTHRTNLSSENPPKENIHNMGPRISHPAIFENPTEMQNFRSGNFRNENFSSGLSPSRLYPTKSTNFSQSQPALQYYGVTRSQHASSDALNYELVRNQNNNFLLSNQTTDQTGGVSS